MNLGSANVVIRSCFKLKNKKGRHFNGRIVYPNDTEQDLRAGLETNDDFIIPHNTNYATK